MNEENNVNLLKVKESPIPYSEQAVDIIGYLNIDFPIEEFEKYVREKHFTIGGGHVLEFLALRKKAEQNEVAKSANKKP